MSEHLIGDQERWESAFVDRFVLESKRARYHSFLRNAKKRAKLLDRLNHCPDFDFARAVALEGRLTLPQGLQALLASERIDGLCRIMSDEARIDAHCCPVGEGAQLTASADFGTVMICQEGAIAVYRPEAPARQLHLFR